MPKWPRSSFVQLRADLRRLFYYALAALVAMTVLLYLGGRT